MQTFTEGNLSYCRLFLPKKKVSTALICLLTLALSTALAQETIQKRPGFGKIQSSAGTVRSGPDDVKKPKELDPTKATARESLPGISEAARSSAARTMAAQSSVSGSNSWLTAEPPIVVPPSPTAASLINAAREGVDLYTGKINIDIPLCALKSRDIEVPVALSYNTSGIRVDDIASWVGMGWSLNAGGSISRVMKGLPDEFVGKVVPMNYSVPGGSGIDAFGYLGVKARDGGVDLANFTNYSDDKKKKIIKYADWMGLDGLNRGDGFGFGEAWDTEPDEFYFNFGRYSGQFVFDQNGEIQLLPNQNFKITKKILPFVIEGKSIPKLVSFTITTDDGFQYTFGDDALVAAEESALLSTRRTIRYKYDRACNNAADGLCHFTGSGNLFNSLLWFRLPLINIVSNGAELVPDETSSLSIYNPFTSTWYLKEILSPGGDKVTFNYARPQYALGYVQSRGERVRMPNLSEVELFDANGSLGWFFITPPGDALPATQLQDVTFSRNEVVVDQKKLTSIVADAGNRIDFELQAATRLDLLGDQALEYIKVYDAAGVNTKSFKFEFDYQLPATYQAMSLYQVGRVNGIDLAFDEYEPTAENIELVNSEQRRLFLRKVYEIGSGSDTSVPPYEFVYDSQVLPRRTGYQQDKWGYFNGNTRGTLMPKVGYTGIGNDVVARSGIRLMIWDNLRAPEASYLGAVQTPDATKAQAGILKKIFYPTAGIKEIVYEINKNASGTNVGGLRVKEIRSYADHTSASYFSENYTYAGGSEIKSRVYQYGLPNNSTFGDQDIFASSDPVSPTYLTRGGVVGYRTVKKFQTGNGKTIYTFKSPAQISNGSTTVHHVGIGTGSDIYPFPPDTDMDFQRGLSEDMKNTLEDETKILNQTTYTHNLTPSNFTPAFSYGLTPGIFYVDGFEHYRAGVYKFHSGFHYLQTEVSQEFNSQTPGNTTAVFKHTTSYDYDVKTYLGRQYTFLKSKTFAGVDDETIKTEFRYPLDVDGYLTTPLPTNPVANAMLKMSRTDGLHILNTPVETIRSRNGQVTEALVQTFKGFPDGSNNVKPYQSFVLQIPQPVTDYSKFTIVSGTSDPVSKDTRTKEQLTLDDYDSYGNLLMHHNTNDFNTAYVWDQKQALPIAQALNARPGQIAFTSFETSTSGGGWSFTYQNTVNDAKTGKLAIQPGTISKSALPAGVYKVTCWAKRSGATNGSITVSGLAAQSVTGTDWQLFEFTTASVTSVSISFSGVTIDDLRLFPSNSQMTTYTYDQLKGVTAITDPNHAVTYYDFDAFGRLKAIKDLKQNILKMYDYNYLYR
jgi:YD repeat-containing protein